VCFLHICIANRGSGSMTSNGEINWGVGGESLILV
jgi:hypothetical protein